MPVPDTFPPLAMCNRNINSNIVLVSWNPHTEIEVSEEVIDSSDLTKQSGAALSQTKAVPI
jgi:hypothetical protein